MPKDMIATLQEKLRTTLDRRGEVKLLKKQLQDVQKELEDRQARLDSFMAEKEAILAQRENQVRSSV